jgi:hypothetical protein
MTQRKDDLVDMPVRVVEHKTADLFNDVRTHGLDGHPGQRSGVHGLYGAARHAPGLAVLDKFAL